MTNLIVIAVGILTAALVLWNFATMRRFKEDYRLDTPFPGQRYETVLMFAHFESGILCLLGADPSALYVFPKPESTKPRWGLRTDQSFFDAPLRIPWEHLDWKEKRILFQDRLWFDMGARKISFYIAKEVGDRLLIDGRKKIAT